MALNPNALITVAEAKTYLKVENALENSLIETLINSATDTIEYDSNTCIKATDITDEVYNGEGDSFLVLRNHPVNSLSAVSINDETIPLESFNHAPGTGILVYKGTFPKGIGNVKVSYNAGHTTIPGRYKTWCLQLVSDYYEGRGGDFE